MQFERGYLSPYFVTDEVRMEVVLEHAMFLLHEKKLGSIKDLIPLLEQVAKADKPLLIVSEDVEGEALATLVVNKLRNNLMVAAVKAPAYGDRRRSMFEDIAILTGARLISEDVGLVLKEVKLTDLGNARKIIIDKDKTIILGGAGAREEIEGRISQLRAQMAQVSPDFDRERLDERIGKLLGGVAVIRVERHLKLSSAIRRLVSKTLSMQRAPPSKRASLPAEVWRCFVAFRRLKGLSSKQTKHWVLV